MPSCLTFELWYITLGRERVSACVCVGGIFVWATGQTRQTQCLDGNFTCTVLWSGQSLVVRENLSESDACQCWFHGRSEQLARFSWAENLEKIILPSNLTENFSLWGQRHSCITIYHHIVQKCTRCYKNKDGDSSFLHWRDELGSSPFMVDFYMIILKSFDANPGTSRWNHKLNSSSRSWILNINRMCVRALEQNNTLIENVRSEIQLLNFVIHTLSGSIYLRREQKYIY